jgi:predicted ribosome quality control (RQC) complex YloA/Tae2 family protein
LTRAIPVLGRRLADEAFVRSGVEWERDASELTDDELSRLLDEVDLLYAECESNATYYLYFTNEELVFALTRLQNLEARAEQTQTFEDIGEAIRVYRSSYYRRRTLESTRAAMGRGLTTELNRLRRLLAKQQASAAHGARAAEYEESGSLLLSNLHAIDRGNASVTVIDYSGAERALKLDPKLTPAQNADRFFARARKAREAAERAEQQQLLTARRLRLVEKLVERVNSSSTLQELEELERENPELLRMGKEPPEAGSSDRYRRFTVVGGLEVFAGKSAANNDELTVRFARPNDYWFHARGTSGSHVVLRWGDVKSKPPKEAIRAAASIAAYYSGARNAKMVPVAYTMKKHVRKPRGAEVGAVVMEREEVIMAEPKLPEG